MRSRPTNTPMSIIRTAFTISRLFLRNNRVTMRFTAGPAALEKTISMIPGGEYHAGDLPQLRRTSVCAALDAAGERPRFPWGNRGGVDLFSYRSLSRPGGPRVQVRPGWLPEGYLAVRGWRRLAA